MDHSKKRGKTKVNKPLAERRRRARINDALLQLKSIVLQHIGKETTVMSKLEKADILEMTVQYIQSMQSMQGSGTVIVDSQYSAGFNECTSYVADYISHVTNNTVNGNSGSGENINTRLLEHLVNVTTSADFLEKRIEKQSLAGPDKTAEQDKIEYHDIKSDRYSTQIPENVLHSNILYTRKSDENEVKEIENLSDTGKKAESLVPIKYSNTGTIPKKRKPFTDCSNFVSINRCENAKESPKKNTITTSTKCDIKSKMRSPTKYLSGRESRPVPKPIKKRLAALAYKPENITSSHNIATDSTPVQCKDENTMSDITRGTQENAVPCHGLRNADNSICDMVQADQVEYANYSNFLFNDSTHFAETVTYNTQPLVHYGLDNSEQYMGVQKENEILHMNVEQQLMGEQYAQKSSLQIQFGHSSDLNAADIGPENDFHFYQHFFGNSSNENVWRPW